jgi:GTP-binding protein YchF
VDAIAHVIRCFEDGNIVHVDGSIDPLRDREVINTELILADLDTVAKRLKKTASLARSGDKDAKAQLVVLEEIQAALDAGSPARSVQFDRDMAFVAAGLQREICLLSAKPVLYVANVAESDIASGNDSVDALRQTVLEEDGAPVVVISGAIEEELAALAPEEHMEFLNDMGLAESGLNRLIKAGYALLGLLNYFTVGEKETKAWTIKAGMKAPQAAGVIHTDFERGFIRAEVISYDDYVACGGEAAAKEQGLWRLEGKEYVVQDGDCINFRFNV